MALEVIKKFDKSEGGWIVKPIGEIDIYTSPNFKEILLSMINEKDANIIIDGEKLEYIDSTGLGILIGALKKVKEKDNNIIILNVKPNISKLLDITGLNKVFIVK